MEVSFGLVSQLFKWLGLDEDLKRFGRRLRAMIGKTKPTIYVPSLKYGQLSIDDWVVVQGVHYDGIALKAVVEENGSYPLPALLARRRQHFIGEIEARMANGDEERYYDGPFLPMVALQSRKLTDGSDRPSFLFKILRRGYYDYASSISSLDDPIADGQGTVRESFFQDWSGAIDPKIPVMGCPGLTLAVITNDMFMIMVRRSNNVSGARGAWHCSVDQGVKGTDIHRGTVDYQNVALHGLEHELGIRSDQLHGNPIITSLGYSKGLCQYGAFGHVLLNVNYEKLLPGLSKAQTGGENVAWKVVPFDPEHVAMEFKRMRLAGEPPMVSFGAATVIMALSANEFQYSHRRIEKAFNDKVFADGRFLYPSAANPPNVHAWA